MAKKPINKSPPNPPASSAGWMNRGPDVYLTGRSHLDAVDALATEMERRWGIGRLRLLVDADLREKFDRQRKLFYDAVREGDSETLERECKRMSAAWRRLDQVAAEAGHKHLDPEVWETHDPATGEVILICRDNIDAAHVVRSGRASVVYSLAEIGLILSKYAEVIDIKRAFPGATVKPMGRERADPVVIVTGSALPCDDDGLDDEVPF